MVSNGKQELDNKADGSYTGGSTQIQQDLALLQEAILLVQLDDLEGSTGTITLLLGQFVPLIQTAFAVFLLDRHFEQSEIEITGCLAKKEKSSVLLQHQPRQLNQNKAAPRKPEILRR